MCSRPKYKLNSEYDKIIKKRKQGKLSYESKYEKKKCKKEMKKL